MRHEHIVAERVLDTTNRSATVVLRIRLSQQPVWEKSTKEDECTGDCIADLLAHRGTILVSVLDTRQRVLLSCTCAGSLTHLRTRCLNIKSTQSVFIGYIGYGHLFKPDGNLAELGFTYRPRWEETKERALLMRYIFASVYAFVVCEFRLLPLARALMRCLWGARRRRDLAPMPPPSMKLAAIQDACPSVFLNERTQFHLIPMYF